MSGLILIVEDEHDLANTLEFNFHKQGFRTAIATTGGRALELAANDPLPDLVLLDLMLPDMSGTEVCQRLRALDRTRHVPIVILTARDDEIDRIVGFEVGADDYVTKPFSVRELVLRVRAMLRRATQPAPPTGSAGVVFGVLRIDPGGHRAWVGTDEIPLTALEYRLLTTFLARKGRVQTRDMLLSDVWGMRSGVTTRTVDTHIQRLRKKLGPASAYLETLRGVGYRFRSSPGASGD